MGKVAVWVEGCKSCLYCVKFCPKNVLEAGKEVNLKGYPYVIPVREKDCIACGICAQMCPEAAIEIYK